MGARKSHKSYGQRCRERLNELREYHERWYTFEGEHGVYGILATSENLLDNPTYTPTKSFYYGDVDGWITTGKAYRVALYEMADLRPKGDGGYEITGGLPILHRYMTTEDNPNARDAMNGFFLACREYALM
jgi:hypothetical protein